VSRGRVNRPSGCTFLNGASAVTGGGDGVERVVSDIHGQADIRGLVTAGRGVPRREHPFSRGLRPGVAVSTAPRPDFRSRQRPADGPEKTRSRRFHRSRSAGRALTGPSRRCRGWSRGVCSGYYTRLIIDDATLNAAGVHIPAIKTTMFDQLGPPKFNCGRPTSMVW
jgi:hypothetical protein